MPFNYEARGRVGTQVNPARACLLALFLLLHALSAGPLLASNWSDFTPLPVDLAIEAPGAGVAPGIASYSGVWQGRLRGC